MKHSFWALAALLLACSAWNCKKVNDTSGGGGNCGPVVFNLNQEFELCQGNTAAQLGGDLKITFDEVTEDSRCPVDVTCIWAGRVDAKFTVVAAGETTEHTLSCVTTDPDHPDSVLIGNRVIRLLSMAPENHEGQVIQQADYRAKLVVK